MAVSCKKKVRKRYIGFILTTSGKPRRGDMIHSINVSLPRIVNRSTVQLTIFDGGAGVVLCQHTHRDEVMRALIRINMVGGYRCTVDTVTTSGTIKQTRLRLEKRVGRSLKVNRPIKELNMKKNNANDGRKNLHNPPRRQRYEQSKRHV